MQKNVNPGTTVGSVDKDCVPVLYLLQTPSQNVNAFFFFYVISINPYFSHEDLWTSLETLESGVAQAGISDEKCTVSPILSHPLRLHLSPCASRIPSLRAISSAAHPQALLVALLETPSPLFHNNNCSFLKPSSSGCQANGLTHQPQATYIISSAVSVITHNLLHMHRAFGWFLCVCVCFWFCKLT